MRSDVTGADPDVSAPWYPPRWSPTKIADRYLAPYLFGRADQKRLGVRPQGFIDLDIPLTRAACPADERTSQ